MTVEPPVLRGNDLRLSESVKEDWAPIRRRNKRLPVRRNTALRCREVNPLLVREGTPAGCAWGNVMTGATSSGRVRRDCHDDAAQITAAGEQARCRFELPSESGERQTTNTLGAVDASPVG